MNMGETIKVLFVCSQNKIRSRTAEDHYKKTPGIEVRSAGLALDAVIPLTSDLVLWANRIIVFEDKHLSLLNKKFKDILAGKKVYCLNIPDDFEYMEPSLIWELEQKLRGILGTTNTDMKVAHGDVKIIFLDIDGVLKTKNGLRRTFKKYKTLMPDILDEFAVRNLNNLVKETNASIVITSTWRYGETTDSIKKVLRKQGVLGNIIGMTPELGEVKGKSFNTITRGDEIQEWLNRNGNPLNYVILDDDPNQLQQLLSHFVKCDSEDGFANEAKYSAALTILLTETK